MLLNYPHEPQLSHLSSRAVSFSYKFSSPIRWSNFSCLCVGGFPHFPQRCSRAFEPTFLRLALGYAIPAGGDKRDNNLHLSRQHLALYCGVSLSKGVNSRRPFIRTFLWRCSDTMIDVAMGGHLRIEKLQWIPMNPFAHAIVRWRFEKYHQDDYTSRSLT